LTSIKEAFRVLRERDEAALIAYVMAGDPAPRFTPGIVDALIDGGADIIELGIPFSDPIADGPTIQAASVRALGSGTTPLTVLRIARNIEKKHEIPIVLMTYLNPVYRMGMEKFLSAANENGVEGLIIPDLTFEEEDSYRKIAESKSIDTIFLAAPSTHPERLNSILKYASGFLYLVGLFGVTGARKQLQSSTIELVKRFVPCTKGRIPLSVGFGVSAPDHVRALVAAGAEGVIVGSAFVKTIEQNHRNPDKAARRLKDMTRSLKTAAKRLR